MTGVLGASAAAGPVCSVPGCGQPATLGWQRTASPAEVQAHHDFLNAGQARLATYRSNQLELQVAELESMHARLQAEGRLTPGAGQALTGRIAAKKAALAAAPAPVVFSDPQVTIQVRGCEAHAVDLDFATVLHQVDCCVSGPCACARPSTIPPAAAAGHAAGHA